MPISLQNGVKCQLKSLQTEQSGTDLQECLAAGVQETAKGPAGTGKTEIRSPEEGNRYPTLAVSWDEDAWGFSVADCDKKLRAGDPRIEVLTSSNPSLVPAVQEGYEDPKAPKGRDRIEIVSMTLQPGEDLIVGKRLREILLSVGQRRALRGTPSPDLRA